MSFVFTKVIIDVGIKYGLMEKLANSKVGKRNVIRFGGIAIVASFLAAIYLSGKLEFDNLKWGIILSSLSILLFGIYDDLNNISWKKQLFGQIFVAMAMIYAGLNIDYIANPFGGAEFRLDQYAVGGYSVLGSILILFWIIGFMNVMNWLDGLDGLAGGVGLIGSLTLFFLSVSPLVNQPPLGIISIALAGSMVGFLFFNFYPAKIFMGTSGSMFLGFILAVLAIFSGGKIATALLVMGFPILDAAFVIVERIRAGESPFKGDDRHLHYRLLERGWSQKKVVIFIYGVCSIFGITAIVFQGVGKILALLVLFSLMTIIVIYWPSRK